MRASKEFCPGKIESGFVAEAEEGKLLCSFEVSTENASTWDKYIHSGYTRFATSLLPLFLLILFGAMCGSFLPIGYPIGS